MSAHFLNGEIAGFYRRPGGRGQLGALRMRSAALSGATSARMKFLGTKVCTHEVFVFPVTDPDRNSIAFSVPALLLARLMSRIMIRARRVFPTFVLRATVFPPRASVWNLVNDESIFPFSGESDSICSTSQR